MVAADVLASDFGAEYVLLNLKNGTYYELDYVGAEMWRLIQTPATVQTICGELVAAFDVDEETCRRDVIRLVGDLAEHGLVELDTP
jgi:hypothetical protein